MSNESGTFRRADDQAIAAAATTMANMRAAADAWRRRRRACVLAVCFLGMGMTFTALSLLIALATGTADWMQVLSAFAMGWTTRYAQGSGVLSGMRRRDLWKRYAFEMLRHAVDRARPHDPRDAAAIRALSGVASDYAEADEIEAEHVRRVLEIAGRSSAHMADPLMAHVEMALAARGRSVRLR